MPNFKKFISNTLHSLADYIERGNCNANEWEAMRKGLIENLELNRQGIPDEQYEEIISNFQSLKRTIAYLSVRIDELEKTEIEDAAPVNIINFNTKTNVQ